MVPANVVPVGTIAWPRNCRPGGFDPSLAEPRVATVAKAASASTSASSRRDILEILRCTISSLPSETTAAACLA